MSRVRHAPRPRGFTLVELLIVIAIIGALVGLVLPLAVSMRASARRAQCQNRMRQLGVAWLDYAVSHNGKFPHLAHNLHLGQNPDKTTKSEVSWIQSLRPHLDNEDRVRICPSDPDAAKRLRTESVYIKNPNNGVLTDYWVSNSTSYALSEYFAEGVFNNTGRIRSLSNVKDHARTMLAFESDIPPEAAESGDHNHATYWSALNYPRNWQEFKAETASDRHGGAANYLYLDGHVELIREEALHERAKKNEDFAAPGQG